MNQVSTIEAGRAVSPQQQFRDELTRMGDQFVAALPDHIKPERFQRIVLTAVLGDPSLLRADRKSLLESAMRAAQDGLMPDKREGAFVVFNTKIGKDSNGKDIWGNAVQWMPMIGGIIKKMHQSGEIAMITAKVVYGGDIFRAWVDDDGEHVAYEQAEHPDFDTIRQVFALAKTKDGAVYVETLTPRDIEKIRNVSRSKDKGPWATWWEEMAKKSAIRRLAKRLPLSADMHDLIQRDNDLYDLSQAPEPRPSLQQRLQVAKLAAPVAADEQEGFDPSFVARETEQATSGHAIEQEHQSPAAPSSADDQAAEVHPTPRTSAADQSASSSQESGEAGGIEAQAEPGAPPASVVSPGDRILMEECIDNMLRDAFSEPAIERPAKIDKLRDIFLGELPEHERFVRLCHETARRVIGKPAERDRATEYLRGKLPAKEATA